MTYAVFKALHIIGIVSWFAGLFYLVRLFIYHVEAAEKPETERTILRNQFEIMEKRLWFGITVPAMVITLFCGVAMLIMMPIWLHGANLWMHIKLLLVLFLLAYHWSCGLIRKQLLDQRCQWTSKGLRMYNEVATLLLVGITFLVVLRSISATIWALVIFALVGALIFQVYARVRKKPSSSR